MATEEAQVPQGRGAELILLLSVFVLAVCGLVYELIAGTLSSYLLGDSVKQFSLTIGIFLSAMGIGSFVSRAFTRQLLAVFIGTEILLGLVGGAMAVAGFISFTYSNLYVPTLYGFLILVGILVGLEIPLMIRILREAGSLRMTVANVLSADSVGAFFASVLFPFALVPHVGIVRAGLVMGLANVTVAGVLLWKFGVSLGAWRRWLSVAVALSGMVLLGGMVGANRMVTFLEDQLYQDEVIFAKQSAYQRIIVTRWRADVRLYLNGHLQFSTVDEYRYHEPLVHPAMSMAKRHQRVLILGGGDGLAAREVFKYPDVQQVDLVDLDPMVTTLFRDNSMLAALNDGALSDPRMRIHNLDAMRYLENTPERYDVILMDLPDPSSATLGKLYSKPFFRLVGKRLAEGGLLACQATSPFRSREAFWCIYHTIEAAECGPEADQRFQARAYQTNVPTFGSWGFVIAGRAPPDLSRFRLSVPARFLTEAILPTLFVFPPDMAEVSTPISQLNDPVIYRLYRQGYSRYLD